MTLEPSVSTEEFAPEFPAQETFAPEFPSENAETMMMGAPEPAPAAPAAEAAAPAEKKKFLGIF